MKLLCKTRLIEIQGADLYYDILKGNQTIIKNKSDEFHPKFKEIAPPNLDFYYLDSQNKFKRKQLGDEWYSYDFVNVSFKYPLFLDKKDEKIFPKDGERPASVIEQKDIREHLYLYGFILNGEKYVRYKRSSGSAKSGSCLFIRKKIEPIMRIWSRTGLDLYRDKCLESLTSYEAYRALSLSSIVFTLNLNPKNILFVKDPKVLLKNQKVIEVTCNKNEHLEAKESVCDIENKIFDGEGLLDVSVFNTFPQKYKRKGMALLRSRFFKCCAFNTNLKQWFEDNGITSIEQLNGITFAERLEDIVLVASESCLKYLKMCKGGFNEKNIKRWCDEINKDIVKFGVVKTDKESRFFDGRMVETTYQLLNTLELKQTDINKLIAHNIEYNSWIRDIKRTPEFIHFYLKGEDNNEYDNYDDDSEDDNEENIAESVYKYSSYSFKNKVCLELINIDGDIKYTDLFKDRVFHSVTDNLTLKLYKGRVLVHGTYATLFGNPLEFLKYIIRDTNGKSLFDEKHPVSSLKDGEINCSFFADGEEIVGSRAPHTTMGNVLYAKNKIIPEISRYFNLTKEIVVVDAINNNIQQRLSGCDYDSDSLLLSNDDTLVKAAKKHYNRFPVPYANFDPQDKAITEYEDNKLIRNLFDIDNTISDNNVGAIVNLSQQLNSHLWNTFDKGKNPKTSEIYNYIAILSVLSGAEIDSAKRDFPFNTGKELHEISKYANKNGFGDDHQPLFFIIVKWKQNQKLKISEIKKEIALKYDSALNTSMDRLWERVYTLEYDPNIRTKRIKFIDFIKRVNNDNQGYDYTMIKKAVRVLSSVCDNLDNIKYRTSNDEYELKKAEFNIQIKNAYLKLKKIISDPFRTRKLIEQLEKMDDGYSKMFIMLYIVYSSSKSYFIRLFNDGAKPLPTLKKTNEVNPKYTLFGNLKYNIDIK